MVGGRLCLCDVQPRPCARKFGARAFHLAIQTGLYALRHDVLKLLRRLLLLSLNGERRVQQIKLHVIQSSFHHHVIAAVGILGRRHIHFALRGFHVVALRQVDERLPENSR